MAAKDFNIKNSSQSFLYVVGTSGNVGIGSVNPGQLVDVQGTVRAFNFIGNGSQLTGLSANVWTQVGNNIYNSNNGNVGINTTNGFNVGIGSVSPGATLDVNGPIRSTSASGFSNFLGNVGIGSAAPGKPLDVQGAVRMTGFVLPTGSPTSGEVLTTDASGNGTWQAGSGSGGWTQSGNNVYETLGGNVGIGTTLMTTSALSVMNGNVGIGTWVPASALSVQSPNSTQQAALFSSNPGAGNPTAIGINNTTGLGTDNRSEIWFEAGGSTRFTVGTDYLGNGSQNFDITDNASNTQRLFIDGNGNFGIGTTTPLSGLAVMNGNVGIGTWVTDSGSLIVKSGNVGIGTIRPGVSLDVNGTVRALFFIGNGSQLTNISAGGWTQVGNNVYNTNNGNVGINTTNGFNVGIGSVSPGVSLDVQGTVRALNFSGNGTISGLTAGTIPQAASATTLSNSVITQSGGNIGVGVAVPSAPLEVNGPIIADGSGNSYFSAGNVGVGTTNPQAAFVVVDGNVGIGTWTAPGGNLIVNGGGNVGINTLYPGKTLDVQGTVRTAGLTMSGQTPISGYVLTASDSAGDTTWSSGGAVSGWTESGNNVYESLGGNVGIGTTLLTTSALSVMNGNVGIGTWNAPYLFEVGSTFNGGGVGIDGTGDILFDNGNARINATSVSLVSIGAATVINGIGTAGSSLSVQGGSTSTSFASIQSTTAAGTSDYINFLVGNNGATEAMRIIDSGNLGIGSLTPGQKLDVQGTVRMTGFTLSNNGAANGNIMVSNSVGIGTWMSTTTLPVGTLANGTANQISFYTAINALAGSSNMVFNAPNVGLGTVTPLATLQVVGNIGIGTVKNGDHYILTAPPNGGMIVEGNMGIGTWAPTAPFEIGGNAISGSGPPPQLFLGSFSSGAGYPQLVGNWNNNTDWGIGQATPSATDNAILLGVTAAANFAPFSWGSTGLNLLVSGNIGIGTITTTGMNTNLYVPTNIGIGTKAPTGALEIEGPNAGIGIGTAFTTTSAMTIMNGNVGIGTWVPRGQLDVEGTLSKAFFGGNVGIGTFGGGAALNIAYNSAGTDAIHFTNTAVNGRQWAIGDSVFSPPGAGSFEIADDTAGADRLMISSAGNVGIGTVFPGGGLVVMNGNVGIGTWIPAYTFDLVNNTARGRIVRRVNTIASSNRPAINTDTTDLFTITALAANILSFTTNLTGTPNDGDLLEIRILDNGTARTITWGASFASSTTTLPLTTVATITLRILLEWNAVSGEWECIGTT